MHCHYCKKKQYSLFMVAALISSLRDLIAAAVTWEGKMQYNSFFLTTYYCSCCDHRQVHLHFHFNCYFNPCQPIGACKSRQVGRFLLMNHWPKNYTNKNKNTNLQASGNRWPASFSLLQSQCGVTPPNALLFLILSNVDFRGFSNSNIPASNISRVQWPALCKLSNVCCYSACWGRGGAIVTV